MAGDGWADSRVAEREAGAKADARVEESRAAVREVVEMVEERAAKVAAEGRHSSSRCNCTS